MTLLALLGCMILACAAAVAWAGRATPRLALLAAAFVLLASGGLYALLGAPRLMAPLAAWRTQQRALEARIAGDDAQARRHPDDAQAWAALGQDYMAAGAYPLSAAAWKQAVVRSGGAPGIIRQYALALIFAADGTVTDEAKRGLDMVLLQTPGDPEARYFTAVWQLQQGHAEEAMRAMKALYHDLPPDSPLRKAMDRQIGRE